MLCCGFSRACFCNKADVVALDGTGDLLKIDRAVLCLDAERDGSVSKIGELDRVNGAGHDTALLIDPVPTEEGGVEAVSVLEQDYPHTVRGVVWGEDTIQHHPRLLFALRKQRENILLRFREGCFRCVGCRLLIGILRGRRGGETMCSQTA